MRGRESEMPEEDLWHTFFDAECIVEKMGCAKVRTEHIVEFGSGYGTFTLPAARRTNGIVRALDIDPKLVVLVQQKAVDAGLLNIRPEARTTTTPLSRSLVTASRMRGLGSMVPSP